MADEKDVKDLKKAEIKEKLKQEIKEKIKKEAALKEEAKIKEKPAETPPLPKEKEPASTSVPTEKKAEAVEPTTPKEPVTTVPKESVTYVPKKEKIFTIPLRKAFRKSEKKRSSYASWIVKDFLERHLKSSNIKIGEHLNKELWSMGIRRSPRRIRVKTVMDGSLIKAELMGFDYKEFKALPKTERKGMREKLMGRLGPKALKKEEEEKLVKEKMKPTRPEKVEKHALEEE